MMLRVGRQAVAQDAAHKAASARVADLPLARRRREHAACQVWRALREAAGALAHDGHLSLQLVLILILAQGQALRHHQLGAQAAHVHVVHSRLHQLRAHVHHVHAAPQRRRPKHHVPGDMPMPCPCPGCRWSPREATQAACACQSPPRPRAAPQTAGLGSAHAL
ncbi:hypothetical protein COO60DRAFT_1529162, partial [Scenedesmus sp. NREL 46B-D3]